jgi:hypothetical protein
MNRFPILPVTPDGQLHCSGLLGIDLLDLERVAPRVIDSHATPHSSIGEPLNGEIEVRAYGSTSEEPAQPGEQGRDGTKHKDQPLADVLQYTPSLASPLTTGGGGGPQLRNPRGVGHGAKAGVADDRS